MYEKRNVFDKSNTQGWLYGTFMPEGLQKDDRVEIKILKYPKSFTSPLHYQKIATKIEIIWEGNSLWRIDDEEIILKSGDYIILPPMTKTAIVKILSDYLILETIKIPSYPKDKTFA